MPETVILRVLMHCEGCANTVKRACARIPGVAEYIVDYPAQKVKVIGEVNREQVLKRILKTGKHAELEPEEVQIQTEADPIKGPLYAVTRAEAETVVVQTVVLKVALHCEGCARAVKKAVKRIPGVTAYDVDFPGQKVTVRGEMTPDDVYRRVSRTGAGKITVLVPPPPLPPPPAEEPKPEVPKPKVPKPEVFKPEVLKPEVLKPEVLKPEVPKPEDPKPEDPKPEDLNWMRMAYQQTMTGVSNLWKMKDV